MQRRESLVKESGRLKGVHLSGIRKMFKRAQLLDDAITLGIGAPDLMPAKRLLDELHGTFNERVAMSYTPSGGVGILKDKIVERYKNDYKADFSPEGVAISVGGTQLLFSAIFSMTDPGDEIIIPDPGFVYYPKIPQLANLKVKSIPLDEKFQMKPELIAEAITDKTKLILINSPSNPTGGVYTKKTIKGIADLGIDSNIPILSDEVYEHLVFGSNKHYCMSNFAPEVTMVINSFSKSYCVPGWRVGFGVGPKELMIPLLKIHPFIVANPPSPFQYAIGRFMGTEEDFAFRKMFKETMESRAKVVYNEFRKIDGLHLDEIAGSFYAFPEVEDRNSADPGYDFVEKALNKAKVVLVAGSEFGEYGRNNFRISFGSADEIKLKEAATRIKENLNL